MHFTTPVQFERYLSAPEGTQLEFKAARSSYEFDKLVHFKHLRSCGIQGAQISELEQVLPANSRRTIQRLLNELKSEKRVRLEGIRELSRWFISNPQS